MGLSNGIVNLDLMNCRELITIGGYIVASLGIISLIASGVASCIRFELAKLANSMPQAE